uniref:Uncharacterized protein n=1 Tax=Parascaris equorum TaxID=6256 RepID=A0A914SED7_PAREQ
MTQGKDIHSYIEGLPFQEICTGFRNEEDKGVGGGVLHIRMTSTAAQKALLALCIVFIIAGLGLTIAGVFSPAWQVVDIREFRAEHQDGAAGESEHHRFWGERHFVDYCEAHFAIRKFLKETPTHAAHIGVWKAEK